MKALRMKLELCPWLSQVVYTAWKVDYMFWMIQLKHFTSSVSMWLFHWQVQTCFFYMIIPSTKEEYLLVVSFHVSKLHIASQKIVCDFFFWSLATSLFISGTFQIMLLLYLPVTATTWAIRCSTTWLCCRGLTSCGRRQRPQPRKRCKRRASRTASTSLKTKVCLRKVSRS